jgi:hypothetical protein
MEAGGLSLNGLIQPVFFSGNKRKNKQQKINKNSLGISQLVLNKFGFPIVKLPR